MGRDSPCLDMKLVAVVLAVLISPGLVHGKKNGKLKYDKTGMKACQSDLDDVQSKIDKLRADLELVRKCLDTPRRDPNYLTYCVGPPEESRSTGNQVTNERMQAVDSPKDRSTAATDVDLRLSLGGLVLLISTTQPRL